MTEIAHSSPDVTELDVAVIGTGFGGLYALHKFRDDLGLNVQAFDDAGDVGGTWYWNRYPGCRVDTEATVYCYSFDKELLRDLEVVGAISATAGGSSLFERSRDEA